MAGPKIEILKSVDFLPKSLALIFLILIMLNIGCSVPKDANSVYAAARSGVLAVPASAERLQQTAIRSILVFGPNQEENFNKAKVIRTFESKNSEIIQGFNYAIIANLPEDVDVDTAATILDIKVAQHKTVGLADSLIRLAPSDQKMVAQKGDKIAYRDPAGNLIEGALLDVVGKNAEVQPVNAKGIRGQAITIPAGDAWIILPEDENVWEQTLK